MVVWRRPQVGYHVNLILSHRFYLGVVKIRLVTGSKNGLNPDSSSTLVNLFKSGDFSL